MTQPLLHTPLAEKFLFLKRWIENPRSLGSITPSSRALSEKMATTVIRENQMAILRGDYILELGPGTGPFTQALLEAGTPPEQLICLEFDPHLVQFLKKRFPQLLILEGDAARLEDILPPHTHQKIATIVSGIPMVNLSRDIQTQIVEAAFRVLQPGQKLYQFTYSPFSSISSRTFNLQKERVGTVFKNFPPATVWSYCKKPHRI